MKKTAIHIIPAPQDGNDRYVIICMDENAYADFLAGKDDSPVTAFAPCSNATIASILIELQDGMPMVVSTTEA